MYYSFSIILHKKNEIKRNYKIKKELKKKLKERKDKIHYTNTITERQLISAGQLRAVNLKKSKTLNEC